MSARRSGDATLLQTHPMPDALSRLPALPKSGNEPLRADSAEVGGTLLDFWRWSASDLLNNTTRGHLAEYLVARALNLDVHLPRVEWDAVDLRTRDGVDIEVKSAAYVQSWHQDAESVISFRVPKSRAWSADTGAFDAEPRRRAQVYIFALLHERAAPDPLNVRHWTFFVMPTIVLDRRTRSQHSISLNSLRRESAGPIPFEGLPEAVRLAALAV